MHLQQGFIMYAKQLKASIRPWKWFNINLGTGVITRMNIILGKVMNNFFAALYLGTLTIGICLDLDCFQYCCIYFQEFSSRSLENVLFTSIYVRNVTPGIVDIDLLQYCCHFFQEITLHTFSNFYCRFLNPNYFFQFIS